MVSKNLTYELNLNLMPLIETMYCDFQAYEGIFFHIFSNAIKFTARGSTVSIKVSFVPFSELDNHNRSEIVIDTSKEPAGES